MFFKKMIKLEKRDLVLSVDWLGGSKCTLRTWSIFFCLDFFFNVSKKGSKCKSASKHRIKTSACKLT